MGNEPVSCRPRLEGGLEDEVLPKGLQITRQACCDEDGEDSSDQERQEDADILSCLLLL